ncbi:HD family phosphohydrolase [Halobacillus massiliensis]|uniref:HD family phosphohydrolase n=1 Tax=Halobacillus massiliensis TaxID=1926286 RepID=UPI001FE61013|nr:HDIG domain-containing metalloprotein [Halobacillus massiliensis]
MKRLWHWLRKSSAHHKSMRKITLPALLLSLVFFLFSFPNVHINTFNVEKFSQAEETIRSPITIENKVKTEQRIREAAQSVDDRYQISKPIAEERIGYIEEIFGAVREVKESGSSDQSTDEQLEQLKTLLSEPITYELPPEVLRPLLSATNAELNESEGLLISTLESHFDKGVLTTEIEEVEESLRLQIQYSAIPDRLKDEVKELAEFGLVENTMFDAEATSEVRNEAASLVQPEMIQAGEVIVSEGEMITSEIYDELEITGLLDKEGNYIPSIGLLIFALIIALLLIYHFYHMIKEELICYRHLYLAVVISVIMMGLMKTITLFSSAYDPLFYVLPAALGSMLIKLLSNERFAIFLSIVLSLMAMVLFNGQVPGNLNAHAGIYVLFSQLAGIFFLKNTSDRLFILKVGTGIGLVNLMTLSFILFQSFEKYGWLDFALFAGYSMISALLSIILTFGLLPVIESSFGILSDNKLLQLSNPNHPLLRKILTEAPGTYHHSVMVANLSEAACEAIGARGLLARVAAYYHDLGKTEQPHYFIENQMGRKNPHDYIEPEQSASIIISHPYDGARRLKKEKFPEEIIDIALQHHGTTLLKYFYVKAKEQDKHVSEDVYRYPGPKPQTKEAAIVCVCDSVEAAVRSLSEPTQDKIRGIVHAIIENRMLDGQFDDCRITFNELKKVENAICETLKGIFHSRIQYPEQQTTKVKEAN